MDYNEFRKRLLKVEGEKHHFEVTNSYGTKEAWRWLKKNKWLDLDEPVTERQFGLIIKAINNTLRDQLLNGKDIDLPHKMGRIEIRKFKAKMDIKEGKLVTNLPPDWKRTIDLWCEDPESYEAKTLVRYEDINRFMVYYDKNRATYNNKSFYRFIPVRPLKKELKERIINGSIDAFLLQRKDEIYKH